MDTTDRRAIVACARAGFCMGRVGDKVKSVAAAKADVRLTRLAMMQRQQQGHVLFLGNAEVVRKDSTGAGVENWSRKV